MVTIKKIEITGFFGQGVFSWNLDPDVNILGGQNGSGKTSIFRICYNVLSGRIQDEHLLRLMKKVKLTFSNGWSLVFERDSEYSGDVISYFVCFQRLPPLPTSLHIFDQYEKEKTLGDLQKNVQVFFFNSFEQRLSQLNQYNKRPSTDSMDDPILLDLMIKDQIDLRNKDFSSKMEKFVDFSDEDSDEHSKFVKSYKKIYVALDHFFQGYDKPFKSSFDFTKRGKYIGIEGLSTGEKQILLLLLMVSNTNQQSCIFFMDEPDLSMHIDWKEILISELHELNPNMQIILSTHAPSVIMQWRDRVKEVSQLIKSA